MFGEWNVSVITDGVLPQKVASAFSKLGETVLGAEYDIIAYLGTQEVNGVNHAILAEQTITTGRDTKNLVVVIFNEKPGDIEATLVSIERVVEGGAAFGGLNINTEVDIPEDAMSVWDGAFNEIIGISVVPFAFVGKQLVNGTNWIYVAKAAPVAPDAKKTVAVVTINDKDKTVRFADLLKGKQEASLGYAFSW